LIEIIQIFLGMPNLNLPLFFMPDPSGSQNRAPKGEGESVKFNVFDWNSSYISISIFLKMPNPNLPLFFMFELPGIK